MGDGLKVCLCTGVTHMQNRMENITLRQAMSYTHICGNGQKTANATKRHEARVSLIHQVLTKSD